MYIHLKKINHWQFRKKKEKIGSTENGESYVDEPFTWIVDVG